MSAKQHKALEHRYLELWRNKGDVNSISEFLTADFIWHGPGGAEKKGIEGMKQFAAGLRTTFPDNVFTFEDIVAEGDKVMYRWSQRATCNGFQGNQATIGKKIFMTGFILDRFEGNNILYS